MNNIFSPKGKVDGSTFIINYIILLIAYIILGGVLFFLAAKFHKMLMFTFFVVFMIKILITFNYKKRLADIFSNLPVAIILAVILGFDTEIVLPYIHKYGTGHTAVWISYTVMVLLFLVQPAIIAFFPSQKTDN